MTDPATPRGVVEGEGQPEGVEDRSEKAMEVTSQGSPPELTSHKQWKLKMLQLAEGSIAVDQGNEEGLIPGIAVETKEGVR